MNIDNCPAPEQDDVKTRILHLNSYHTLIVYNTTCRGLFEKHKLLFAFQICVKILQGDGNLNMTDYQFFLRGGQVMDKEVQPPNPCPLWMTEQSWDNIFELDKLSAYRGIAEKFILSLFHLCIFVSSFFYLCSFEQLSRDWHEWYLHPEPETIPLKGEWEVKLRDKLQRMVYLD